MARAAIVSIGVVIAVLGRQLHKRRLSRKILADSDSQTEWL